MIDPVSVIKTHCASAPRYTSYPTAPSFKEGEGRQVLAENLAMLEPDEAVSIYLHIPFCDRLCWFCGCNTKHTLKYAPVSDYVDYLVKEIVLVGEQLEHRLPASMIHFGGGSPSMLQPNELIRIRQALEDVVDINDATEISFEIDPFGLLQIEGENLFIVPHAKPFTRIMAMQFDQFASSSTAQYSKAV